MAIDVVSLCVASVENESGQTLATILAIFFLAYTGITILLASSQLYITSNRPISDTKTRDSASEVAHSLSGLKR